MALRDTLALLTVAFSLAAGCSRTGLLDLDQARAPDLTPTVGDPDAGTALSSLVDAGPDAAPLATSTPPVTKPPPTKVPDCTPTPEICNDKDDDCNGVTDDALPSIPCAGGGEQYCVAGRYSACPTRCDTCIPGSERVCFLSYCTYWAVQTCSADGKSFGTCREEHVPSECAKVASASKESAELEQCCIDKGYCCRDEYDLDHDGNRGEMLGSCDEVSCTQ